MMSRAAFVGALAVAFCTTAYGQAPAESAAAHDRLIELGNFARRANNRAVPLPASSDPNQAALISGKLADLVDRGAASGVGIYRVDQSAVDSRLGKSTPFAERQQLRMFSDPKGQVFVVSSAFEGDGLSGSSYLFYNFFFTAYAGMHSSCRSRDVPLARGVAALAALDRFYQSPLASLPDFHAEAAAAQLIVNANPAVIELLQSHDGGSPALRQTVEAAWHTICEDVTQAKEAAGILLGDSAGQGTAAPRFVLSWIMPKDDAARQRVRNYAIQRLYHPGAAAEFLRAWAAGRNLTDAEREALYAEFDRSVMARLNAELKLRGLEKNPTGALLQADFDASTFLSAAKLLVYVEPRIQQWRSQLSQLAEERDVVKRDDLRRAQERKLHAVFNGPEAASRLAQLNPLLARSPSSGKPTQPEVQLFFEDRTVESTERGKPPEQYVGTIQLVLKWKADRSGPSGADAEEVVFAGSSPVSVQRGPESKVPDIVDSKPSDAPKMPSDSTGKEIGSAKGGSQGQEGEAEKGEKGTQDEGKMKAPAPPKDPIASVGISLQCLILGKPNAAAEARQLPLAKGLGELAATAVLPPRRGSSLPNSPFATVWAEIVQLRGAKSEEIVRLELANGQTFVSGSHQEVLVRNKQQQGWNWFRVHVVIEGDVLLGENGAEVKVVAKKIGIEDCPLASPLMAVYENLFVSGVLTRAARLADVGGLDPQTQVEIPGGSTVPAAELTREKPVAGFFPDVRKPAPTLVRSNKPRPVETIAELRYTLAGQPRVLRVAPNQPVVVFLPEERLQTEAAVSPDIKLPREEEPDAGAAPLATTHDGVILEDAVLTTGAAGEDSIEQSEVLPLRPGMLLVASPTPQTEPPVCVPLESITAVACEPAQGSKGETGKIETRVLEIYNEGIVRAEGVLVKVLTKYENITGVEPQSSITQPLQGTAPGAPAMWSSGEGLPTMVMQHLAPQDAPFLTTTWPAKTWLADRTTSKKRSTALRHIKIATDKGTLLCGNWQLLKAIRTNDAGRQEVVEVHAEKVADYPGKWQLLYLDPEDPDPAGELTPVTVKHAEFQYTGSRGAFDQLVGNGLAEQFTVERGGETKLIRKDIYFANGFLVVGIQESDLSGGANALGGAATGEIGPDPSIGPATRPVEFSLPGLEPEQNPDQKVRVRFSNDELTAFEINRRELDRLRSGGMKWGEVKDRTRFLRFLALYFDKKNGGAFDSQDEDLLLDHYVRGKGDGMPTWTDWAFHDYCKTRAAFLEHGAPADLYRLAFHYVFLLTVFYETGNSAPGDALRDDFVCIAAHIALGEYEHQKGRPDYYKDPQYRLGEALLWTRDVMFFIRDGRQDLFEQNAQPVTVPPQGWENILQNRLAVLSGEGTSSQLVPSPDNVNLGNLWIQLHKYFHGAGAADLSTATFYSIVSPNQEPDGMFSLEPFTEGPYARQNIRQVLGVKKVDPRRVRQGE